MEAGFGMPCVYIGYKSLNVPVLKKCRFVCSKVL